MATISDGACRFVGVDLHKHTITIAVVDAARKPVSRRRFSNLDASAIITFLKSLGPFELVVEATASYEWFVQLVEPLAKRVVLAHPGKLRVIAESTQGWPGQFHWPGAEGTGRLFMDLRRAWLGRVQSVVIGWLGSTNGSPQPSEVCRSESSLPSSRTRASLGASLGSDPSHL